MKEMKISQELHSYLSDFENKEEKFLEIFREGFKQIVYDLEMKIEYFANPFQSEFSCKNIDISDETYQKFLIYKLLIDYQEKSFDSMMADVFSNFAKKKLLKEYQNEKN